MKPLLKYTLISLLVVAVAGITAVGVSYANGDTPNRMEILAEFLGMTEDDVREAFQSGKTLENLAEEAGVDIEDLKASLQENWEKNFREHIQDALDNGDLTKEHVDWLTEGLEKGFLDGGRWFGGRGRMGHFESQEGQISFGPWSHIEGKPGRGNWEQYPHCDQ
jgi:hypothetical protein